MPYSGAMEAISLAELTKTELDKAKSSASGRAAATIYGGHEHNLRQTLVALTQGNRLAEHESSGEATLFVLQGRVRFSAGADSVILGLGDYLIIPDHIHAVDAEEDSVILLTVSVRR